MRWNSLVVCIGLAALAVACSDDDTTPADDTGVTKDMSVDSVSSDGYVAPTRLTRDKAKVCPAGFSTKAPAEGKNTGFEVEGQKRAFNLHFPDKAKFSGPRPLMVYFHGTGGSAGELASFQKAWKNSLNKAGWIVAGPQGELNGTLWPEWDAMRAKGDQTRKNKDLLLFDKLVDCVAAHYQVDAKRIYVSGLSAGGIMTNRVLRERSKLVAGGVVGSGVWDFTEPAKPEALDGMAVMVTWGGDNDEYSGSSGGKTVPKINFAEQAAFASAAYEKAAGVNQVHCKGHNVGHAWLSVIHDVMIDFLSSNPKGLSENPHWKLKKVAANVKVTCSEDAATFTPKVTVSCKKNKLENCQVYCQSLGDCVVENGSAAPILAGELKTLGFSGANLGDCGGCITNCEADAAKGGTADDTVLACYKTEAAKKTCGTGLPAALTIADFINACCKGATSSEVCGRFCKAVNGNSVASSFFTACAAWKKP